MGLWRRVMDAIRGENNDSAKASLHSSQPIKGNSDGETSDRADLSHQAPLTTPSISSAGEDYLQQGSTDLGPKRDPSAPAQASSPNRMGSRSDQKTIRRVNIGLDFGTSATKVVVRLDEVATRPRYFIVPPSASRGTVLFPSTVALEHDKLLFGELAEDSSSPDKVRSFKMNLPAEAGSRHHAWRGQFVLGGTDLTAEDVSTLYLAAVLADVLGQVRAALPGTDLKFTVNAAAPLDQMEEEPELRQLFNRIVYRALKMSGIARPCWPLDDVMCALQQARTIIIPADDESPVSVFPETHAAMTSYMLLPGRDRGNYATVDVGAGSTDVAFFWFHAMDGQPEMCYYGACSGFVGMDDIDRAIGAAAGHEPADVRQMREQDELDLTDYVDAFGKVLDQIYQHYRFGFGRSYDRCRGERQWRDDSGHAQYTLCLVGGGCMCDDLVGKLKQALPILNMRSVDVDILRVPDDLPVLLNGRAPQPIRQVAPGEQTLLLLAHGLANRAVDIPRYEAGHVHERVRLLAERPGHEEIYG